MGRNTSERGYHRTGEAICQYLLASGKEGAQERFRDDPVFQECLRLLPMIEDCIPAIKKQVEIAAKKPFRKAPQRR